MASGCFESRGLISEVVGAVKSCFDLHSRQWLPDGITTSNILFTYPLFFETARSTSISHTFNQILNNVVDLSFLRNIKLLAASLNRLLTSFCFFFQFNGWFYFAILGALIHNWWNTILLAQLFLELESVGEKVRLIVVLIAIMATDLAFVQFKTTHTCTLTVFDQFG